MLRTFWESSVKFYTTLKKKNKQNIEGRETFIKETRYDK